MAPSTEVVEIEATEMLLEMSGPTPTFNEVLGNDGVDGDYALGKERGIDSGFGDLW